MVDALNADEVMAPFLEKLNWSAEWAKELRMANSQVQKSQECIKILRKQNCEKMFWMHFLDQLREGVLSPESCDRLDELMTANKVSDF